MTTSKSHKYNQLKWLYSALSGLCAAFFLALFSGSQNLDSSILLLLSTLCFAICFPLYTTFALTHVYIYELDAPIKKCDCVLNQPWVINITIISAVILIAGFTFLIGYFSLTVMCAFIAVICICFILFVKFILALSKSTISSNIDTDVFHVNSDTAEPSAIILPLHLRIFRCFLGVFACRATAIGLSLLLLGASYLIDSFFSAPNFLSKSAGIITFIGLIMTIKHSYLFYISSPEKLLSRDYQETQCGPSSNVFLQNKKHMNNVFSKATDEGIGLILILVGTAIGSFGSYIPLISIPTTMWSY